MTPTPAARPAGQQPTAGSLRHAGRRRAARALCLAAGMIAATALGGCLAVGVGLGAGALVAHTEERGIGGVVRDTEMQVAIMDAWLAYDSDLVTDLGLMIYDGRVLVSGAVRDPETRAAALRLAGGAKGVREVIDEVRVGPRRSLATAASDELIARKLQAAMLLDHEARSKNYHRRAYDGAVYIIGVAQDEAERNHVVRMARNLSGVRQVVAHIDLAESGTAAVAARPTGRATTASPAPDTVPPRGATATTGAVTATELPDLPAAGDPAPLPGPGAAAPPSDASQPIPLTGGLGDRGANVAASVGPDPELSAGDAEISVAIGELWYQQNPDLAAQLGLLVHNGRVILTGVVPNEEVRAQPYGLAWQVDGVHEVYNEIRVGSPISSRQAGEDRVLENRLASLLLADPAVNAANYAIRVDAGRAHLLGDTGSADELARVVSVAESLEGVREVVHHVVVTAPGNGDGTGAAHTD